jgi:diguanylate cyclase (GGDEF)-like protein/PAS domain S-box-containing protein
MELRVKSYRRIQLIRWAGGLCALALLIHKVVQLGQSSLTPTVANGFIWGTTFLTVILLLWRERNHAASHRKASEEHARFITAAETSPDAFSILDSVRDKAGDIVGFQYKYVNSHSEKLWNKSRMQMLDKDMCEVSPTDCTRKLMNNYRKVVLTGEPYSESFRTTQEDGSERWLRRRVIKLDDGVAITVSDATEIKANEDRYRNLSNLSKSVFETAPFSIIETDLNGMIRAMNHAAEKLTGYQRAETVGKIPLTALHDAHELNRQTEDATSLGNLAVDGFVRLTKQAAIGEVEERDWTYIQRDGSTLPVHVAITAVRDGDGEISGFIAIASDISERKQLMSYLNHMASHDQLTGLSGRKMLRERILEAIERATKNGRKIAVFVIDLDHFKRLNDSLGHRAGDEILVGMAERMQESLRRSDTLGRLGGDEFVVVMPHIANVADVERCAQRLVERISSTERVGDRAVNLTASIHLSRFCGQCRQHAGTRRCSNLRGEGKRSQPVSDVHRRYAEAIAGAHVNGFCTASCPGARGDVSALPTAGIACHGARCRHGGAVALASSEAGADLSHNLYPVGGRDRADCSYRRVGDEAVVQGSKGDLRRVGNGACCLDQLVPATVRSEQSATGNQRSAR